MARSRAHTVPPASPTARQLVAIALRLLSIVGASCCARRSLASARSWSPARARISPRRKNTIASSGASRRRGRGPRWPRRSCPARTGRHRGGCRGQRRARSRWPGHSPRGLRRRPREARCGGRGRRRAPPIARAPRRRRPRIPPSRSKSSRMAAVSAVSSVDSASQVRSASARRAFSRARPESRRRTRSAMDVTWATTSSPAESGGVRSLRWVMPNCGGRAAPATRSWSCSRRTRGATALPTTSMTTAFSMLRATARAPGAQTPRWRRSPRGPSPRAPPRRARWQHRPPGKLRKLSERSRATPEAPCAESRSRDESSPGVPRAGSRGCGEGCAPSVSVLSRAQHGELPEAHRKAIRTLLRGPISTGPH